MAQQEERLQAMRDRERRLAVLDTAIARGLGDADAKRVTPLAEVFDRLQRKYATKA